MRLSRVLGHVGLQEQPFLVQLTVHQGQLGIEQHVEIHRLLVVGSLDGLTKSKSLTTWSGGLAPLP